MEMISEAVYLHYLSALLDGNKKQCTDLVTGLIKDKADLKEVYINLFQRSMYRVGQLWEKERCTVADEHIATKITESLIELSTSKYPINEKKDRLAVITCIDKEFHELGARLVTGFFEVSGWNAIFLGSNTPQSCMIKLLKEKKPDILGISVNLYINIARLIYLIELVHHEIPELKIIVGGQAFAGDNTTALKDFSYVEYIPSLDELEQFINRFSS
ncbi:MAG: cobalamin-binding protein [Ignavibacteria bacterium]|nr:cobalamin-binding protein [Ignavibacteria bacterium]